MRFSAVTALSLLSALVQAFAAPAPSIDALDVLEEKRSLQARDAFTRQRAATGGGNGPELTSEGTRPDGAEPTTIPVAGHELFAWESKTPHDKSEARDVYIIIHGVDRNANTYWKILNNAWAAARDAGYSHANDESIRLAPLFFSTTRDSEALNSSTLAWGNPSAWTGGDGSTHPAGSDVSTFTVLDALVDRYSNSAKYPHVKRIVFVAHGGGAQVVQRYAVLGKASSVEIRYVVGDPSTMLYFTKDRPVEVDTASCPTYNDFRYGLDDYYEPYALPEGGSAVRLFKRYASRDVHYLVGLDDTSADNGDQLCGGRAAGGSARKDRSQDYWAYLHLLSGSNSVPSYPGYYPALDSSKSAPSSRATSSSSKASYPQSRKSTIAEFKRAGADLAHTFHGVTGAGHSASEVLKSSAGLQAIFSA